MGGRDPRRTSGTRRNHTLARVKARRDPCWICGLPIDYSLPARHPLSYECDELIPVSLGGSPYRLDNCAAAHRCCNNWRSNRTVEQVESVKRRIASQSLAYRSPFESIEAAKRVVMAIRIEGASSQLKRSRRW